MFQNLSNRPVRLVLEKACPHLLAVWAVHSVEGVASDPKAQVLRTRTEVLRFSGASPCLYEGTSCLLYRVILKSRPEKGRHRIAAVFGHREQP